MWRPGAASADSIAYIKGGNVWLTTGDASREFQVTSTGGYSAVSQADDGTLLATAGGDLRRLDRMGTVLSDIKTPVLLDDPGTGPSSSITPPLLSPTVRATRATRSRWRPSAPVIRRGGSPTPDNPHPLDATVSRNKRLIADGWLRMVIYVTDMEAELGGYHAIVERLDAAGASPPATLVEVSRLAIPGMTVEIEITAGR